jgi:KUP system potassium uptake protein
MNKSQFTKGGALVALGIVFGDIGTSPLYVMSAITHGQPFSEQLVLGGLSCVLWTLILLATGKYVLLALNADNHGEGGIFALYAKLKQRGPAWIIVPSLIGCATLMADGFITPAISISSAIEGLNVKMPSLPTIPIVIAIISGLFFIQKFGTESIGKYFGPIMIVWFTLIAGLGLRQIMIEPSVLVALSPYYALTFLINYPGAIWVMGAVFLCTTGAEAMYSDLGHIGKKNIRASWIFVIICLFLSYLGQGAFLLNTQANHTSVFYSHVPDALLPYVIFIATLAAIIASQALITGVFTLVSEAIKLKLWTNLAIKYPATEKGQVYVPAINTLLFLGCLLVVAIFKRSADMEGAYGLAISIDMLMTSLLLFTLFFVGAKKKTKWWILFTILVFVNIELVFLVSNLSKFAHGGWFPLAVSVLIFGLLYLYYKARQLRGKYEDFTTADKLVPVLDQIQQDKSLPYDYTNLVYFTRSSFSKSIEKAILHSITIFRPKKARFYWLLNINTTDNPRGISYKVEELSKNSSYFINVCYGFKEEHHIEYLMRKIYADLGLAELEDSVVFKTKESKRFEPDFKFIVLNTRLSALNRLSVINSMAVRTYRAIKSIGLSSQTDFGLHPSVYSQEFFPLVLGRTISQKIKRDGQDNE